MLYVWFSGWFSDWIRKRLAVSIPLLQEWRRSLSHPLFFNAVPRWDPDVFHGTSVRTNVNDRRTGCLQNCADF